MGDLNVTGITRGLMEALNLIVNLDAEIYGIIGLTLLVTLSSTLISTFIGVPLGMLVGSSTFRLKTLVVRSINAFMGLPPVVAGLFVYLLLTRTGPFGSFELLFSVPAMVIAQVLIVTPIVAGLTISGIRLKLRPVRETCEGLGLTKGKTMRLLLFECRYPILSAVAAGFGRAIAEVGAIMLVGGNIQYKTRVMTTAIVLETGKGNYGKALALGILLLGISFAVNWFINVIQERKSYEDRSEKSA